MKVAILMPMATQRGGGELMLWQLMEHARTSDVEWIVIFFEKGPLVSAFRRLGIETYIVQTGRLRHIHRYLQAVQDIASIARSHDVDLIFSWSGKPHLYGSVAAQLEGLPAAWYQLGCPVGRHLSWMDRIATALPAESVFTLSKFGASGQKRLWPTRPTRLVYPSVNLDAFDPSRLPSAHDTRKQLGLPLDGPLVGIVGRLQRWKGIHVFVEAMPHILQAHPKAHGVIVGGPHDLEPDYPAFLRGTISKLGLTDRITVAGFQENVPAWMQAMDVMVHASDHEPFGIVIVEAMALGKPVVAGDQGGPPEIITDGQNGLLARYGDEALLARQVNRYLDHPAYARSIGAAARQRALDFAPSRYAERFVRALYTTRDRIGP